MVYLFLYFLLGVALISFFLYLFSRGYKPVETSKERPNRRKQFRLNLYNVKCDYTIPALHLEANGSVIDISSTGIKLHTFRDFPIGEKVAIDVTFVLQNENYKIMGIPIRKHKHNEYRYEYGIQIQHESEKDQEKLFKVIWEESKKRIKV